MPPGAAAGSNAWLFCPSPVATSLALGDVRRWRHVWSCALRAVMTRSGAAARILVVMGYYCSPAAQAAAHSTPTPPPAARQKKQQVAFGPPQRLCAPPRSLAPTPPALCSFASLLPPRWGHSLCFCWLGDGVAKQGRWSAIGLANPHFQNKLECPAASTPAHHASRGYPLTPLFVSFPQWPRLQAKSPRASPPATI